MPWTWEDALKHKSGLTEEKSKQWAAIANSVLKKCMADGGEESECAASAIRQANGVVKTNEGYHIYAKIKQDGVYEVKTRKYRGKNHLVIPVIMMVEGVHHGSHGPLYHSIQDLGKFPESWNGIPVVIDHPVIEGVNVSANSPDIEDVGKVFNTYVKDNKKLAAEVWLDEEKLQAFSKEVLAQIKQGIPLEVSLGMFTEEELVTGEWNGEHYEAIAKNHRPDHLALLPGSVGACSLADGCGLGVNSEGLQIEEVPADSNINVLKKEVIKMVRTIDCAPCLKKKVDDLIANSQGKYTEEDRELLETLNEVLLDKIAQPVEKTVEVIKEVEKIVEVNVLSAENQEIIDEWNRQKKEKRDTVIKTIQDNLGKETWTDEVLGAMHDDILEKVAGLVQKKEVVDYSLNSGTSFQTNDSKVRPLPPTGVRFKNK
jgi:hypothetical protein